jgi:hypothetical protein
VIRYALGLQMAMWLCVATGVVIVALGVVLLAQYKPAWMTGDWPPWDMGFLFVLLGMVVLVASWLGGRMSVRCDRRGIRVRSFRTTFIPASDVKALVIRSGVGSRGVPYRVIDVIRQDGSEVRLQTTTEALATPQRQEARLHARIQAMYEALGSVPSTPPT